MRLVAESVFFVFFLQIRVDNTQILVLNFTILEIDTGIMLQVPSVYLALGDSIQYVQKFFYILLSATLWFDEVWGQKQLYQIIDLCNKFK